MQVGICFAATAERAVAICQIPSSTICLQIVCYLNIWRFFSLYLGNTTAEVCVLVVEREGFNQKGKSLVWEIL